MVDRLNRRTVVSGVGLIALAEAVGRTKAAFTLGNIGNGFAALDDNFNFALLSGAEEPSASAGLPAGDKREIEADALRVDLLPFLHSGVQTHQFCSYDRAGDNYDAEYLSLYTETNDECVLFDAMGPGCLYRHHMNIWHDHGINKGIRILYYFDNELKPRSEERRVG